MFGFLGVCLPARRRTRKLAGRATEGIGTVNYTFQQRFTPSIVTLFHWHSLIFIIKRELNVGLL